MGGAAKVLSLLSAPLPLLPGRASAFFRLSTAAALSSYRCFSLLSDPPRRSSSTVSSFRRLQNQTLSNETPFHDSLNSQPEAVAPAWPEWARLVQWLTDEGYVNRALAASDGFCGDDFFRRGDLPEEFLKAGQAFILFARENPDLLRSMSKKEIGIVVDSGSPFLFKDGESSTRRLTNFLNSDNNVLQQEKAETIDLVRFLLSYASKFENNSTNVVSNASVNNLLVELVTLSGTTDVPNFMDPNQRQPLLQQQDQLSRPRSQIISRKPGDWFCSKCNFMNFARNTKCLECSKPKPKRILTGEEWECPQCDFFNNGRNTSCLRCDCKRPGEVPLPSTNPSKTSTLEDILNKSTIEVSSNAPHNINKSGSKYAPIKDSAVSQTVDRIVGREPSKTSWENLVNQRQELGHVPFNPLPPDMFAKTKTREMEVKSNPLEDEGLPQKMPVRKGENRFVVSRKKDRSLTSPQYKRRMSMEQANNSNSNFVPFVPLPPDYFAKKRENKVPEMGCVSEKTEEINTKGIDINSSREANDSTKQRNRSEYGTIQVTNSNPDFGHFVPFPPEYLTKNRENKLSEMGHMNEKTEKINTRGINVNYSHEAPLSAEQKNNSEYSNSGRTNLFPISHENPNSQSSSGDLNSSYSAQTSNLSGYNGGWNKSLEGSSVKELNPVDMSEEAKAERWFKRAAQIKDISELENIPDEDFPEIMPMRKGVNRFVVSKRKTPLERRLASPQYRKNLSTLKSDPEKDKGVNLDRS
ncbi:zinc finger (Ran-binding) family protein [Carex rostrata]